MWKSLYENETDLPLYLKVDVVDSKNNNIQDNEDAFGYRVLITNHVKLWKREFTKVTFQEMMLFSNQDVETDDKQIFSKTGLSMLQNPKHEDKKEFTETTKGNIHLELLRLGPIVWKASFELTLCDAEDFFYFVTRQLLMVIKDQVQSERSLRSQLLKKDQEIQGFMEMLPENSPLMRCLRTKKYNDQEHRLNHSAVFKLFGTDPEDVICPQQIIQYKRALSDLKYDDDESNTDEPNSRETRRVPATAIKKESSNGGSSQANTVKQESNYRIRKINDVKIEPNDGTSGLNNVKIEPNDGTSGLNNVKIEPNDGTSGINNVKMEPYNSTIEPNSIKVEPHDESESNFTRRPNHAKTEIKQCTSEESDDTESNDKQTQSKGTRTSTQSLPTADEEIHFSIADHSLNTRNPPETLQPNSPDMRPSQSPVSTPKKRRKNLNY